MAQLLEAQDSGLMASSYQHGSSELPVTPVLGHAMPLLSSMGSRHIRATQTYLHT